MTTDKEKIRIQQAHLDGVEIDITVVGKNYWRVEHNPAWDWVKWDYRIKEPEYIAFDKDTFPFEPVWIALKGNSVRFLITIVEKLMVPTAGGHDITYQGLLKNWEIVSHDGSRSVCGAAIYKEGKIISPCETDLPRSEECVLIVVPESEVKDER